MEIFLESVQTGTAKPSPAGSLAETAIDKTAVRSAYVGPAGVEGDVIVDTENHGGPDQAVYVYTRGDYEYWEHELRRALPGGMFGENFTFSGISSATVNVGDRFVIGDVVLEAAAARIPCGVFTHRMGESDWVARFRAARRPGVYCRVIEPGNVKRGDAVALVPAENTISILETQDLFSDREPSVERLQAALASPIAARARAHYERALDKLAD